MMTGVGPLPKLTLLEAKSDSLVVQLRLTICSFCNEIYERLKKKKKGKEMYDLLQNSTISKNPGRYEQETELQALRR